MDESSPETQAQFEEALGSGAFINARGEEIQITEQMIQQACALLADQLPNHLSVENFGC